MADPECNLRLKAYLNIPLPEEMGGGHILYPYVLKAVMDFVTGNCGMRQIYNIEDEVEYSWAESGKAPKIINNTKIKVITTYGTYQLNTIVRDVLRHVNRQQRIKALYRLFDKLKKELEQKGKHQYIFSDQLNRSNGDHRTLTKHFINWLKKNKYGTVFSGPITYNHNYINNDPSFIQTWIWVPEGKPIIKYKDRSRLNIELPEVIRPVFRYFVTVLKNYNKEQGRYHKRKYTSKYVPMALSEYLEKNMKFFGIKDWAERNGRVNQDISKDITWWDKD